MSDMIFTFDYIHTFNYMLDKAHIVMKKVSYLHSKRGKGNQKSYIKFMKILN